MGCSNLTARDHMSPVPVWQNTAPKPVRGAPLSNGAVLPNRWLLFGIQLSWGHDVVCDTWCAKSLIGSDYKHTTVPVFSSPSIFSTIYCTIYIWLEWQKKLLDSWLDFYSLSTKYCFSKSVVLTHYTGTLNRTTYTKRLDIQQYI